MNGNSWKETEKESEIYQWQRGAINNHAFGKANARRIISEFGFLCGTEQSGFARRLETRTKTRKGKNISNPASE